MIYSILLSIHVIAGILALLSLFVAIFTKLIQNKHKLHVLSGRVFAIGMTTVFVTTIPLTLIKPNVFLLVIGIFSFYMTFHGWRMAVNRKGTPGFWDKRGTEVMIATAAVMMGIGSYQIFGGNQNGIILLAFGGIGGFLAFENLLAFKKGSFKGKERISSHIGSMMGASIAAITAALVTNIQTDPAWLAWIAPTLLITPLIIYTLRRHRSGKLPKPSKS